MCIGAGMYFVDTLGEDGGLPYRAFRGLCADRPKTELTTTKKGD